MESVDEDGNAAETYFFTKHRVRDLDCYFEKGDLSNVTARELRRVMRFDPDDLVYAGKMEFLYTRQGIARLVGQVSRSPLWSTV